MRGRERQRVRGGERGGGGGEGRSEGGKNLIRRILSTRQVDNYVTIIVLQQLEIQLCLIDTTSMLSGCWWRRYRLNSRCRLFWCIISPLLC